jgi:NADH-quinone oxidoreductase subunit K
MAQISAQPRAALFNDVTFSGFNSCDAMPPTLQLFLVVSAALFSIGLLAALSRRHAIFILIGIEMMLAAANLNFVAFWRFSSQPQPQPPIGVMVAIFSIAIAAAEAAVGLALVIAIYRHYQTTNVDQFDQLKG